MYCCVNGGLCLLWLKRVLSIQEAKPFLQTKSYSESQLCLIRGSGDTKSRTGRWNWRSAPCSPHSTVWKPLNQMILWVCGRTQRILYQMSAPFLESLQNQLLYHCYLSTLSSPLLVMLITGGHLGWDKQAQSSLRFSSTFRIPVLWAHS